MAQYDGAVRVNTAFDSAGFNKGVDRMEKAMQALAGRIEKLGAAIERSFNGYIKTLQGAGAAIRPIETATDNVAAKTERLGGAADRVAESYGKAAQEADRARTALSGASDAGSLDALSGMFEDFKHQISELESAYQEMFSSGGAADATQFEDFRAQLDSLYEDFNALNDISVDYWTPDVLDALDGMSERLRGLDADFRSVSESAAQTSAPVEQMPEPIEEAAQEVQSLESGFEDVSRQIEDVWEKARAAAQSVRELQEKADSNAGVVSAADFETASKAVDALRASAAGLPEALQSVSDADGFQGLLASANEVDECVKGIASDFEELSNGVKLISPDFLANDIEAAEAAVAEYQDRMSELDDADAGYGAWASLYYEIEEASEEVGELRASLDELSESGQVDDAQYDELSARIGEVASQYGELSDAAAQAAEDAKPQYMSDWENMATASGAVTEGFERIRNAVMTALTAITNPAEALDRIFGAITQNALRAASALLKMVGSSVLSGLRLLGASAAQAARELASMSATVVSGGIKRLGAWLSNAAKSMTLFGRSAKRSNDVLKRSFTTILKYGLGVRSFYYLFRKIRSAIKEGFQNLAQYSDRMNQSISGVISSFTQFKNQFAASFAPLVNAVAPALTRLINLLSQATFWVGQLLAAFYGQKTVIKAKAVQEDYAASLDKTKKSAKEAQKQLAGFDELEILKDSGNGGDSGGVDPSSMFEEVPVESSIRDLADRIKAMWEAGDLTELGAMVGLKIKAALDNIPWDEIKAGTEKTGKRLATFLNGMISVPDLGKSIGKTIAEAVNTALSFLDGFSWNFHWADLGDAIMDTIEAACDNLEWGRINRALQGFATGLADLLNAIFARVEVWKKVGRTLGKALNAAVNAGITFLERFDFEKAARAVTAGLNAMIDEIEWDKIGRLLADYFGGVLRFLYAAIMDFHWADFGDDIAEMVNEFVAVMLERIAGIEWASVGAKISEGLNHAITGIRWDEAGTLVGQLFGGALTAAATFIRGLDYGEIVQAVQDFFSNAIQQIDFYDLLTVWGVAALIVAVKKIIATHPLLAVLTMAVLALGPELGTVINRMIETIPWAEVGQNISNFLIAALNRLHEAIKSVDWFALGQSVGESLGNINWSEIVDSVIKVLWDLIVAGIETLAGVIVGMGPEGIINALWAAVKTIVAFIAFGSLFSMISGAISMLFSGIGLLIETSISGVGFLALKAIALLGPLIIKGIGALIALIGKTILFLGGSITSAISGVFTAVSTAVSTGMSSFTVLGHTLLTGAAATIATAALGVADAFLLIYDVAALHKTANEYNNAFEAHNRETETALDQFTKLYQEKGPEVAAEWAKTCYDIDTTGKSLEEAQGQLVKKVDSLWDDVPQNMWDGFKQGWSYYFGEDGKGLSALLGDTFTTAVKFVKEVVLGEHSPSTVFDDMGQNSALGYMQGFQTRWPELAQFFTGAFEDLKTRFSDGWNNVKTTTNEKLSELKQTTLEKWNGVKTDAVNKWNEVKSSVGTAVSSVKQDASAKVSELSANVKSQWSRIKADAVNEWNGLKSSIISSALSVKSQVASAFQSLQGTLAGVWNGIRSAASGAMSSVSSMVGSMASSIASRVSSIQSTVSNITSSASSALSKVADKMDDLTRKASNGVSLGGFSSGGVITDGGRMSWWDSVRKYASGTLKASGSLFVAGEAGPEIVGHVNGRTEVLNESQIASAIYSAVLAAMQEAVGTLGGFLSQQMTSNTNALITTIGQIQAPPQISTPQDTAIMERLAALQAVPYQAPAYAMGTVMPYEVVAEIRRQTSELKEAIYDNGEIIIQAVVSAVSNHGLALVNAINNIQTAPQQGYDANSVTRTVISEINRQTRMLGKSPLLS